MINYLKAATRAAILAALFLVGAMTFFIVGLGFVFGDTTARELATASALATIFALAFAFLKRSSFLKPPTETYIALRSLFRKEHRIGEITKNIGSVAASAASQAKDLAIDELERSRARSKEESQRRNDARADLLEAIQTLSATEADRRVEIKGVGCVMTVQRGRVTIAPSGAWGFLVRGLKGVKSIPIESITATQFKPATFSFRGYLQLSIHGGMENKAGLISAVGDENSFLFDGEENNKLVEAVQSHIHDAMRRARGWQGTTPPKDDNLADELQKLVRLRLDGMLTDEEFANAKSKLINNA